MRHLFSPDGLAALDAVISRAPLVGFDFDGTLAPIVPRPETARVPLPLRHRLERLSALLPVAVVSGRSLPDLSDRLGFEPRYTVGNHGAERQGGTSAAGHELDGLRDWLRRYAAGLHAAGVVVEDKGLSLALHYRTASRPDHALATIRELLRPFGAALHTFPGKMVENVTAPGSPDKAVAVHDLVRESGAPCAVFFGDDVNDEPVFASAPADWLTVRVGFDDRETQAAFFIHHTQEMVPVIDRMLARLVADA
ncbi:trehalose-phosphatase [Ramlibacter sp. USB13]|uniref:Trehalose 6-phosphate phosphatase n=1 Tax=Ramlibacter cellulosilyticus TaxID=2764187 RepID=A0A923MU15_9BURK|nr:trehalose-phosphatase [Ramlibacter cellulosilyticus]MBC5784634.1 trehalose-phosphatase [Ramlibacter cellulosilyticus]